jgi:hypothetical protein
MSPEGGPDCPFVKLGLRVDAGSACLIDRGLHPNRRLSFSLDTDSRFRSFYWVNAARDNFIGLPFYYGTTEVHYAPKLVQSRMAHCLPNGSILLS